jgi:hypothetical protein
MHPPAAAIVGDAGGGLDDPEDQPLYGPLDLLAHLIHDRPPLLCGRTVFYLL